MLLRRGALPQRIPHSYALERFHQMLSPSVIGFLGLLDSVVDHLGDIEVATSEVMGPQAAV